MYELPTKNLQILLKRLMSVDTTISQVDEVLYGSKCASTAQLTPFHLHILPPTAVALLSPDVSAIVVFADRRALSVPRYSNLKVMMEYVLQLSTN